MTRRIRIHWFLIVLIASGVAAGVFAELPAAEVANLFWSFQPVRVTGPPDVKQTEWSQSAIDRFILSKLERHGLVPSPQADKRTLIRRATFDLTGLPPTPEEIDDFLADPSSDGFAKVIDRLLASPFYGERWGRHWLDVVRYADARDLIQLPAESDFREAWRYRDWVVSAFNRDLPYDDFITRQVAGDLLQPADPAQIDIDSLVATGMLAIADFVPGDVDKQQMIADYVNDQIDVVGRAFLGLTLACARCHNHKFDPISTEDYYSMAGIFFSTRLVPGPVKGNTPLVRVPLLAPATIAAREAEQSRDKARLVELSHDVATLADREYRAYLERRVASDASLYLLAALDFVHSPSGDQRPMVAGFAKGRGLEEGSLMHWIRYLDESRPHPAFAEIRSTTNLVEGTEKLRDLSAKLMQIAENRRTQTGREIASTNLAESEIFRFRGDDRRLVTNDARQVTSWPNRGRATANATPLPDVSAPTAATVMLNGNARDVLRFSGKDLLQVPGSVPSVGSLFVVYRPDPKGGAGQRLLGWEDSSVGQHGLGIMVDAAGSIQAILRRNAASGDVSIPAVAGPSMTDFQVLCISWGPAGVTVHRNGQAAGMNKGIDSVSSDPAITALRIGGPGSGASSRFQGEIAELRVYAMQVGDPDRTRLETELTSRWCGTAESQGATDVVADLYEELVSPVGPFQLDGAEREKSLSEEFRQKLVGLRDELERLKKKPAPPDIPKAVVVQEGGPPGTPHEGFRDAVVYLRGNHLKPGPTIPRGVPKVIAGAEPLVIREGSGRRELARWLADPANPLTARVMVNRIWQHHFGAGLVRTSANFGAMGESPSHPELLDYLAERFIASGWSVKAMHRMIMLSSTYQQCSGTGLESVDDDRRQESSLLKKVSGTLEAPRRPVKTEVPESSRHLFQQAVQSGLAIDPENRFLWRANRRRLEAEALRDSLLAVALRLDDGQGGPGFQETAKPRRSLYLMAVRTGAKAAEFGPLFDAADCSGIVERRTESIVAPQALFLMNDPLVSELAKGLAERVTLDLPKADPREQIRRLYEITLGRPPVDIEMDVGLKFLDAVQDDARVGESAWVRYCHLIVCTNEFLYVD